MADFTVINIDDEFDYDGYNTDFGPLTLNYVAKYCRKVHDLIQRNKPVVHCCSSNIELKTNACCLSACYLLLCHRKTPE